MDDREVDRELERAHELATMKVVAKAVLLALAILVGCPTVRCVHQDWQKAHLGQGEWSSSESLGG